MKKKDIKDFYRWEYIIDLRKNANTLIVMIKFSLLCLLIPLIYVLFVNGFENIIYIFKVFSYMAISLSLICILVYFVYTIVKKGRENMLYEMTNRGIDSIKIKSNKKKINQSVKSDIEDILKGRDIVHLSHKYTSFKEIREIIVDKKEYSITLKSPLNKNIIYAKDFDFVLNYIIKNIDKSTKIKYKRVRK